MASLEKTAADAMETPVIAAKMALALRITVDKLIHGRHIECRDLGELLSAELAIVDACKNLRSYIDTALTFTGSEDVSEF